MDAALSGGDTHFRWDLRNRAKAVALFRRYKPDDSRKSKAGARTQS